MLLGRGSSFTSVKVKVTAVIKATSALTTATKIASVKGLRRPISDKPAILIGATISIALQTVIEHSKSIYDTLHQLDLSET